MITTEAGCYGILAFSLGSTLRCTSSASVCQSAAQVSEVWTLIKMNRSGVKARWLLYLFNKASLFASDYRSASMFRIIVAGS